ncbi:MAG: hypothetical protein QM804_01865 [Propionicimonas sp.]
MPPSRVLVTGCSALAVLILTACQPAVPVTPPSPTSAPSPTTSSPTPSPTPTVDLRTPGAARRILDQLLDAAGPGRLIMVELTAHTASVSVLTSGSPEPITWAYRDAKLQLADSDLQYVDQASFDLDDFDLSDVGRLFRVAAALSGQTENQTLQIVDYSGGRVMMTVTTNPESRTVFFNPDSSLLPELDYQTEAGIAAGLADVLAGRVVVRQVGVDSETGAWASYAGPDDSTVRCQRPPKIPVTTVVRDDPPPDEPFAVNRVDAAVIWQVVQRTMRRHDLDPETTWSVIMDDPTGSGEPQLRFVIGGVSLTTDATGRELPNP